MKQRVITAIVLLAVLALVVWQIYTPVFIFVIAFLSAVAANEIMKCAKIKNKFIITLGTIVAALVPFTSSVSIMDPWISGDIWSKVICLFPGITGFIAIIIIYLLAMLKGYKYTRYEDVAIAVMASLVVPYGFSVFGILRDKFGFECDMGVYLIFYGLICALGTDVGAQLGGMAFGKHKMSPNISPKKTVEGAVCGVITSIVLNIAAMLLYCKLGSGFNNSYGRGYMIMLICVCPIVSFLGMMGDLSASVLKRNFDVKDFGKIFPGHGGVMDRFDSSLFTLPATYLFVTLFEKIILPYIPALL